MCKDGALTGKIAFVRDEFKIKKATLMGKLFFECCNEQIDEIRHNNKGHYPRHNEI